MKKKATAEEIDAAIGALTEQERARLLAKHVGPMRGPQTPEQERLDRKYLRGILANQIARSDKAAESQRTEHARAQPRPANGLPPMKEISYQHPSWRENAKFLSTTFSDLTEDEAFAHSKATDEEFRALWNDAAAKNKNPINALKMFLLDLQTSISVKLLFQRERRIELERRVEALERSLSDREWKGIWNPTDVYHKHNLVTYSGSLWVSAEDSIGAKPGESEAWRLVAKRGRDGKDAR